VYNKLNINKGELMYQILKVDYNSNGIQGNIFFTSIKALIEYINESRSIFYKTNRVDFVGFTSEFFGSSNFELKINKITAKRYQLLFSFTFDEESLSTISGMEDTGNEDLLQYMEEYGSNMLPQYLEDIKQGNDLRYYNLMALSGEYYQPLSGEQEKILRALALRSQI
jgi:hypothetical protein